MAIASRLWAIVLLAPLTAPLAAQLFERADARTFDTRYQHALPVGDGCWALVGETSFAGNHLLSVRAADGSVNWEAAGAYFMDGSAGDVVLMPDSGLLHAGLYDGCDYTAPWSRIRRYAPDGTLLWTKQYQWEESHPPYLPASGSISRIAVAGDSVHVLDLEGSLLHRWPVPSTSGYLWRMHWLGDEALGLFYGNGAIRLCSPTGSTIASASTGQPILDAHYDGAVLHVLHAQSVHSFSASLEPLGIAALPSGATARRLHPTSDGLFISNSAGLLRKEDNALISLFAWPGLPASTTHAAAVRDGTVLAAGATTIANHRNGFLRTHDLTGAAVQRTEDVEVLLAVDSAWMEFIGSSGPPYWRRKASLRVRIVNHGTQPIDRVTVSSKSQAPWVLCEEPGLHVQATGLALPPGDTALVWTGIHIAQMAVLLSAANPGEVCVVATAPNGVVDRAPADNVACQSVRFTAGMAERAWPLLLVAPNPAVGACRVAGLATLGAHVRFALRDAMGREAPLPVGQRAGNDEALLDLSDVAPGIYVLQAHGAAGSASARLLVER